MKASDHHLVDMDCLCAVIQSDPPVDHLGVVARGRCRTDAPHQFNGENSLVQPIGGTAAVQDRGEHRLGRPELISDHLLEKGAAGFRAPRSSKAPDAGGVQLAGWPQVLAMHLCKDPLHQLHPLGRRRRLHQRAEQGLLQPLVRLDDLHQAGQAQDALLRRLLGQRLREGGQGVLVRGASATFHALKHHPSHVRRLRPDRSVHQGVVGDRVGLQVLHRIQEAERPVEITRNGTPLDHRVVGDHVQQPRPRELLEQGS
mmetsp:Transcript_42137/g.91828  ORF Transcript_42137/g.91828 Transcript_42137/m.91828 type:complete len:257 (-) Transcript_42137:986-1756(-)